MRGKLLSNLTIFKSGTLSSENAPQVARPLLFATLRAWQHRCRIANVIPHLWPTDRAVTCPYLFVAVEDLRPLDISSQRGLRPLEPLLTLPARQCLPLAGVPMPQRFITSTFPQYSPVADVLPFHSQLSMHARCCCTSVKADKSHNVTGIPT